MTIAILATEEVRKSFELLDLSDETRLVWADSLRSLLIIEADAYFDFLFDADPERTAQLNNLLPNPLFIYSPGKSLKQLHAAFIRIVSGQPGPASMLKIAADTAGRKASAQQILSAIGQPFRFVRDSAYKIK